MSQRYCAPVMFLKYSVAYALPSRLVRLEDSINSTIAGAGRRRASRDDRRGVPNEKEEREQREDEDV